MAPLAPVIATTILLGMLTVTLLPNKCKMQKVIVRLALIGVLSICIFAKPGTSKKDLWQSWKDVNDQLQKDEKPLLIDVYTNWCYYCKVMDATTYKNDSVYRYLKDHFYRFKFNAEAKDSIVWQSKVFKYNNRYQCHDFAVYLTRGNIVYPTTVIITPGAQPFYMHGQLKPEEIEMLLRYFGEANYKRITLEEFAKTFTSKWK
jgi:thioredoxin-related protein